MLYLVLSMILVFTLRDILSGSPVVLAYVYTLGSGDSAVDAFEERMWLIKGAYA